MTSRDDYDVIVVGLGAMGSATVHRLATAGARVLGIDAHTPPHARGSSHGDTRITRLSVGEGDEYVPLVARSHAIWRELEAASGEHLLSQCGGLIMGVAGSAGHHGVTSFVEATTAVAERHDIPHERLDRHRLRDRYPMFATTSDTAYFEPAAGYVFPERCLRVQLDLASRAGAVLRPGERVVDWDADRAMVRVITDRGERYRARRLVLAAGAWMRDLLPEYEHLFPTFRQVLYWFDLADRDAYDRWRDLPVYIWFHGTGAGQFFYGFPALDGPDGGVKIACETYAENVHPELVDREVTTAETRAVYDAHLRRQLPGLAPTCLRASACLYTVTPDHRFVVDAHPRHPNVVVVSPCSGHGFKHSAAIGEAVAQRVENGRSTISLDAFSLARFT